MPGYADRYFRRPLDESMLLRVVVVSGLVSGTDIAKFYAKESGLSGTQTLEEYLHELGISAEKLAAVKRAYVQTDQFGSVIIRYLQSRGADEAKMRAASRALNACETAQLMAIKKGKPARPIGEMMVELGHITHDALERIITNQGMARKINQYEKQIQHENSLAGRLGLNRLRDKLKISKSGVALLVLVLLVVGLFNAWYLGGLESHPDKNAIVFGGKFNPGDTNQHIKMISQHYSNMITELKADNLPNARHYRDMLEDYFTALKKAGVDLDDSDIERIHEVYSKLNFEKIKGIPRGTLPRLSTQELEKRLSK